MNPTSIYANSIAIFQYGSRVYGTAREDSDYDQIAVSNSLPETEELIDGDNSYKIVSSETFIRGLAEHDISFLECLFLPQNLVVLRHPTHFRFTFELNLPQLRKSISAKASHSWVKAKKKMTDPYDVDGEFLRGKKSLFHSFRILMFGEQLAKHGRIVDYGAANDIWKDIDSDPSTDWQHYHNKWKKRHNALSSSFRILAAKE